MSSMVSLPVKIKSLRHKSGYRGNGNIDAGTLVLKVAILRARNLTAKDRSGSSDPYMVLVSSKRIGMKF